MPIKQSDIDSASRIDRASILLPSGAAPYVLVILNQPIGDLQLLQKLWSSAVLKVCADGGSNRLYDALNDETRLLFKPDFIAGDLDSIRHSVKEYYESLHVPVHHFTDQDSTDFGKCLLQLGIDHPGESFPVVALGGTGGRVDQAFHSIHTLFKHEITADADDSADKKHRQVTLVSDESLTFLVGPGTQKVYTPRSVLGPTCGLIPISGPSIISTRGLQWDVEDWKSSFGTQVSTSNALTSDEIIIQSDLTILFTVEIRSWVLNIP
ncbi:thiamine pyrophosphokinase [Lipomyces japonicus]|uniref:thiamine pyrophosphokinase n=1 Tax=Lipomyces japonicus TaxID=56871 RepID=UPI0034CED03C